MLRCDVVAELFIRDRADAAPELDEKAKKALAAAAGDPEKEAKIRAALEKAAKLKAEKAAAAAKEAPAAPEAPQSDN
ncbi:MAG: hypothetical protein K2I35_08280 [Duncaniella sp.]|nr:hypothetical protein [Duncaniella sp.]